MNTTITINTELKEKLDSIGTKKDSYNAIIQKLFDAYEQTQRYSVQNHAKQLLTLHEEASDANTYHRKILEKVANGQSKSWEEIKQELLK